VKSLINPGELRTVFCEFSNLRKFLFRAKHKIRTDRVARVVRIERLNINVFL